MTLVDAFIQKYDPQTGTERENLAKYVHDADRRQRAYEKALEEVKAYEMTEVFDLPPITDDLLKDEIIQHLMEYHSPTGQHSLTVRGHQVSSNGTKATKDELIEFHNGLHSRLDGSGGSDIEAAVRNNYVEGEGWQYGYEVFLGRTPIANAARRHKHGEVVLNDEQSKVIAAVRKNQKAASTTLSVTDRKVLKELVDNDFGGLKAEMRAFAADTLTAQIADINEEWDAKEKAIPDFATQATTQHRKHSDKVQALKERHRQEMTALTEAGEDAMKQIVNKAAEKGVVLKEETERYYDQTTGQNLNRTAFKAEVEGRKEAIAEATKDNQKMVDRALMTVEKQRLTAQRQVLLSSVPDAALPIVEAIPDAKTLMVEAQMTPRAEINSKQS